MIADEGIDEAAFARGAIRHSVLGTPETPGTFAITDFQLARRHGGATQMLAALPADLVASEDSNGSLVVHRISPLTLPAGSGVASSSPFQQLGVLASPARGKAVSGLWLDEAGWQTYLAGRIPSPAQLVASDRLWSIDPRVGIGLDAGRRSAAEGRLFTVQAVAFRPGVGFLAGVRGAEPPSTGVARLGGDGRSAAISPVEWARPHTDLDGIVRAGRCRLVLTSPGIFDKGWLPPGAVEDSGQVVRLELAGVRARIVCAAVPRAEVVSGWDLALAQPKPARRVAPPGTVYWLDELEATAGGLRDLLEAGLWNHASEEEASRRRAEGFNRFAIAVY
jgi:CRISPR-associated protein Cmr3